MTYQAQTMTMAEENSLEQRVEAEARREVFDRWMDDREAIAELMCGWFADLSVDDLVKLAELIFDVPEHDRDDTELGRQIREAFQKAKDDALRDSKEVHQEADRLWWAHRNGCSF